MKTRKLNANGTPYYVVSGQDKDGKEVHHLELRPPVTIRNVRVYTVRGSVGPRTLQMIAEAYDAGYATGYFEGKRELEADSQRVYIEDEDFTTEHQRATN